jgi:hypothetical protein
MTDRNDQTEKAREPHEHDAAAWAKHREEHQPYRQPDQVLRRMTHRSGPHRLRRGRRGR